MDVVDLAQENEVLIRDIAQARREPSLKSPDGQCILGRQAPVFSVTAFCCAA